MEDFDRYDHNHNGREICMEHNSCMIGDAKYMGPKVEMKEWDVPVGLEEQPFRSDIRHSRKYKKPMDFELDCLVNDEKIITILTEILSSNGFQRDSDQCGSSFSKTEGYHN